MKCLRSNDEIDKFTYLLRFYAPYERVIYAGMSHIVVGDQRNRMWVQTALPSLMNIQNREVNIISYYE